MAIDLHIHTNFSDGTDSPDEIIEKSESIGLNAISITDHETMKGLSKITKKNIEVIKGVEISAKLHKGHNPWVRHSLVLRL